MASQVLNLVADKLSRAYGDWRVDGLRGVGPGSTAIMESEHGHGGTAHVDLGFVLDRNDRNGPVVWDCASGFGGNTIEALDRAVTSWIDTTAVTVIELLTQGGQHADHYHADDPQGFPGWHTIHGGIVGFGWGEGPHELQRWWVDHPVLPRLSRSIVPALNRPELNGVKLFFGSSGAEATAEVRLNGLEAPTASEALLGLDWPRFEQPAYVKSFVLLVHDDH